MIADDKIIRRRKIRIITAYVSSKKYAISEILNV